MASSLPSPLSATCPSSPRKWSWGRGGPRSWVGGNGAFETSKCSTCWSPAHRLPSFQLCGVQWLAVSVAQPHSLRHSLSLSDTPKSVLGPMLGALWGKWRSGDLCSGTPPRLGDRRAAHDCIYVTCVSPQSCPCCGDPEKGELNSGGCLEEVS